MQANLIESNKNMFALRTIFLASFKKLWQPFVNVASQNLYGTCEFKTFKHITIGFDAIKVRCGHFFPTGDLTQLYKKYLIGYLKILDVRVFGINTSNSAML